MLTVVSIVLYALSAFIAIIGGTLTNQPDKSASGFATILAIALFIVAAIVHIWG